MFSPPARKPSLSSGYQDFLFLGHEARFSFNYLTVLRCLFSEIMSVNLPRSYGTLKGFGFVHYEDTDEGEEAASNAIRELNGTEICGVKSMNPVLCSQHFSPPFSHEYRASTTPPRHHAVISTAFHLNRDTDC